MQWLVYLQALNSARAFVTYLIQNNNNKKKGKAEDTLCFDALIHYDVFIHTSSSFQWLHS